MVGQASLPERTWKAQRGQVNHSGTQGGAGKGGLGLQSYNRCLLDFSEGP